MLPKISARKAGVAYTIALIVSVMVVGMAGAGLAVSVNKLANTNKSFGDTVALYVTEAGLAEASYYENLDTDPADKTLCATWYGSTASALDQNGSKIASPSKDFNGGTFTVTREKNGDFDLLLTCVGRYPKDGSAGQTRHTAVAKLKRTSTTVTTTSQFFQFGILARNGNITFGSGRDDGTGIFGDGSRYQMQICAINTNPATALVNPGSGNIPIGKVGTTQNYTMYYLFQDGYSVPDNIAHVGTMGGYVFLNINDENYDNVAGTPNTNWVKGDVIGGAGVVASGYGAGGTVIGRTADPRVSATDLDGNGTSDGTPTASTRDFDNDGTAETFLQEFEGRYPEFDLYPTADYIEQLTSGAYDSVHLDQTGTPGGTAAKSFEYKLLQYIGGTADETYAGVAAGTFTGASTNINSVKAAAATTNNNAAVLDWAQKATDAGTNMNVLIYDADGAGAGTAIRISNLNNANSKSIDLTADPDGAGAGQPITTPITLYLDRFETKEGVSTRNKIKVPAGSTIVTTTVANGSTPGFFISNNGQLEFAETSDTPANAVNRIYTYDSLKDRTNYAFQLWADGGNTGDYIKAARKTQIITDGIFRKSDNSPVIRVTNGDLEIYSGATSGSGVEFRANNITWLNDGTERYSLVTTDREMSFSGGFKMYTSGDINITTLGNFRFRNGAKLFAGGGGGGTYTDGSNGILNTNGEEEAGGLLPTNMNAKTRIFTGWKGDPGIKGNLHWGGMASSYLNPKLPPENTSIVSVGPVDNYGVIYMGNSSVYASMTMFAPDYNVDIWQTTRHNIRGGMIVKGFPDGYEGIMTWDNTNLVKGEITGQSLSVAWDVSLLDGKNLTDTETTTWKDYKIGGVTVID